MFFKFAKSDIKYGFYQNRWKLALTFLIFACLSFYHFLTLRIFELSHPEYFANAPTVGDYLVTIIGGYGRYDISSDNFELFTMPIIWVILFLWTQFTGLYYPFNDLSGMGKHLIVVSGQRGAWWASKCLWTIANTLSVCAIVFAACTTTALFLGAEFSMNINHYLPSVMMVNAVELTPQSWNLTAFALSAVVVMICFSLLQLTLSLIIKPLYTYLILAFYAIAATYIQSPLLIGNYMMFARSDILVTTGLGFIDGLVLCGWLIIVSCSVGFIYFKRMDIMGGDW